MSSGKMPEMPLTFLSISKFAHWIDILKEQLTESVNVRMLRMSQGLVFDTVPYI